MMKKLLLTLSMLAVTSSSIHAYTFTYKNATDKPLYFEPYAWGATEQFKFFKGERGSKDGWGVKGPQLLKPGQQKEFSFYGVWCHGKIMVGHSPSKLTEIPELAKTDREQYNKIISNLTKAAIGSSVATMGASGAIIFTGIQLARLFEKSLCNNYHFIIGESIDSQGNNTFFATATPW